MADVSKVQVVAIDGPAGAGKSSVARALAMRLGWRYLDTGAMYRAVTAMALERAVPLDDPDALGALTAGLQWQIVAAPGQPTVIRIDGRDVTDLLRTPDVTAAVGRVADSWPVRRQLRQLQRREGEAGQVIMEGRDIGTHVFPDARWKLFLDASLEERARRRLRDFQQAGHAPGAADVAAVAADIRRRDEQDEARSAASLRDAREAPGVRIVDTTDLSFEQVVEKLAALVESGAPQNR